MSGYLNFLQSLTNSQQRHEIQRLVAAQSQGLVAEVAKEMLKHPTVVEFNKSLGFHACWKIRTMECGMEAGEIGSPSFSEDFCIAPMVFRYENLNRYRGWTTSNLEYQLVVNAFVYIDDDGEPMVGTVRCSSNQSEVDAEKELLAGLQKNGYVNYLRALTPLKQCSAIFHLAELTWGIDNPKFLTHPQLSAAARTLGIAYLDYCDHQVGPVELERDRCTVPIMYSLYGSLHDKDELLASKSPDDEVLDTEYSMQVHILASISDKAPTSSSDIGCELSIENMWFSIIPIEDYEQKNLMIVG
jgi:hypothetical protein